MEKINIFWFRRDLRLHDNAGLYHALQEGHPVLPLFIFDTNILDKLEAKKDARVAFIHDCIAAINEQLVKQGSGFLVKHGKPLEIWAELVKTYKINAVITNHDYEPYAKGRDQKVQEILEKEGITFQSYKDHVIFEKDEVIKDDGDPYTVFTPYSRKWLSRLENGRPAPDEPSEYLTPFPSEAHLDKLFQSQPFGLPTLKELGFEETDISIPEKKVNRGLIKNYDETRDFPAINGTSRLGVHFRFGTISIRDKAKKAFQLNKTYLNELIWRDFYAMILDHFPHVVKQSFRKKYDNIEWRNKEDEFEKWCQGKTGYPIVDAGMRELNQTGYMHNRVRMVTASFLTKHLLIDWRWGEAYFAKKLLDYDLASNNGGWQWAAGSGTDAAPYFRIFNPTSQQKKFDKNFKYIKEWVPEYGSDEYPAPMVDHKFARERCLKTYKEGLDRS